MSELLSPALIAALSALPTAALVVREDLSLHWTNPVGEASFGSRRDEIPSFLGYQSPANIGALFHFLDCMRNRQPWKGPLNDDSGGRKRTLEISAAPLADGNYLILVFELTEHQEKLDDAIHSSRSDRLTSLPNRRYFNELIAQSVKQARRGRADQALLLLDLDGFKPVNDTYGHDAGDAVLVEVAKRMQSISRETDYSFRLGGDEFACIIGNLRSPEDAGLVADKLIHVIRQPIRYGNQSLDINVSIGIAMIDELKKVDDIIKAADRALYSAKGAGKGCWRLPPAPPPSKPQKPAPSIFDTVVPPPSA